MYKYLKEIDLGSSIVIHTNLGLSFLDMKIQ